MKSVMLSIKPKYCELIASGKKTIEVRRTRPKIETPFKCYIYCTIGNGVKGDYLVPSNIQCGKVIGEFVCDRILIFEKSELGIKIKDFFALAKSCIKVKEMREYIGENKIAYGWHISDLKIYDKPKPIMQFYKPCPIEWKNCPGCELYSTYTGCCMNNINRPPKSWCYVEEI